MRPARRRLVATMLPIAGLVVAPAALAQSAADTPNVNPENKAQTVRDDYTGHVEVVRGTAADERELTGSVFNDKNKNSKQDTKEKGISGVSVSNGRDVVTTNGRGEYTLPAFDNMTVFATQPAGYAVPVNENNIAQFAFNHFPKGSPDLKFGGVAPTGALPKAVNFPMARSKATAKSAQNCDIASDTQTYDKEEVGYASQGAIRDLVDRKDLGGCGVLLLGDNVGDDLSLNDDVQDLYAKVPGPIRALPGNHDMDYDAADDAGALDTHRNDWGPGYFSYDVGQTHVVALDNIEYKGAKGGKNGGYFEKVTQEQLDWLAEDLKNVPANTQVVLAAHAPIVTFREVVTDNASELFDVLKKANRTADNTVMIGGHTHTIENLPAGQKRAEWAKDGIEELPFPQLVAGAVSGDWYSGSLDEHGLPHAYGSDGGRPGTLTLALSGNSFVDSYQVRQEGWGHRTSLGINSPTWRAWAQEALTWREDDSADKGPAPARGRLNAVSTADLEDGTWLTSNVYLGSSDSRVEVVIDGGTTMTAEHTQPGRGEELRKGWEFSDVPAATANLTSSGNVTQDSSSLWRTKLPADLDLGTHTAEVTVTDEHGRTYTDNVRFTVLDEHPETD